MNHHLKAISESMRPGALERPKSVGFSDFPPGKKKSSQAFGLDWLPIFGLQFIFLLRNSAGSFTSLFLYRLLMYRLFSRLAAPPGILLPSVGRSVSIATWIVPLHERYYLRFYLVAGGGALFSNMIPKIVKNVLSKRTTGRILLSHADFFLHWWVFPFLFVSSFITSPFFPWMSEHQRRKRYFADEN